MKARVSSSWHWVFGVGGNFLWFYFCLRFILHEKRLIFLLPSFFFSSSNLVLSWLLNNSLHCSNLYAIHFRLSSLLWLFQGAHFIFFLLFLSASALTWPCQQSFKQRWSRRAQLNLALVVWISIRFSVSLRFMFYDELRSNREMKVNEFERMKMCSWNLD